MAEIPAPFVAGFYRDPDDFLAACHAATAAGYRRTDGYMPYPVHGAEAALGIKRSWIGRVVLPVLLLGAFGGFMMQYWMMKWDWPLIVGGKPYNSWPAFVVITFESGILSGAITNFVVMLFVACRIYPRARVPVLKDALTDETFALCIPVDGNGTAAQLRDFLARHKAEDVGLYVPEQTADEKQTPPLGGPETAHA